MPRLLHATITPFHAQVLLTTSPDAEHPGWGAGQVAVASPVAIAIATVPDIDEGGAHHVDVEVWVDEPPGDVTEVFRCPLLVSSWGVALQDVLGADQRRVSIPAGEYEAAIYAEPVGCPRSVRIVLTRT